MLAVSIQACALEFPVELLDGGAPDEIDAHVDVIDAPSDAGHDAQVDAGHDAQVDAGIDATIPDAAPSDQHPLACVGTGTFSWEHVPSGSISRSDPEGGIVDVAMLELATSRRGAVLFLQSGGLRDGTGSSGLALYEDETSPCPGLAPGAPSYGGTADRAISRVLATTLRGAPAMITVSDVGTAGAHVMRDGTSEFATELDAEAALLASRSPRGVAVGDLDGDRVEDLVLVGHPDARIALLGGSRAITPVSEVRHAGRAWLVDVDGDGALDLIAGPDASQASPPRADLATLPGALLLGDGHGGLAPPEGTDGTFAALSSDGPVAIVDIDVDGDPDVVQWRRGPNRAELLRNESTPGVVRFGEPERVEPIGGADVVSFSTFGMRSSTAVADVDLDGAPDVVALGSHHWVLIRGGTAVPRMHVGSSFTDASRRVIDPPRFALGDAEGDGDLDFAIVLRDDASTYAYMMLGEGGGARTVAIDVRGAPSAGTQVCIAHEGALSGGGGCGGTLGHSLGVASTAQSDPTPVRSFYVPSPIERVDARVIVRVPGGARIVDVPGLAVGVRHVVTIPD
ncbi:hypothetical protein DB32_005897 [Sandaracinus amylolyticus]|uniref:Uncharacterized protein n=2 Tax=Sandaracinus amylolyticus TaxID=927083 RepID=A0A0F6W6L5_9BACT|nr:hypothetical protein DB32_005897 [Sandaracinus amylolyticus]